MIEKLKSKISLHIKGKNPNHFIKKIAQKKINILSIKQINKNEIKIVIYKKDYEKILKIKSIYEILEEEYFGYIKIKKTLKINIHLITSLIIGIIIFTLLTNTIFKIEIIHSNKEIRNLINTELQKNGIKKYTIKKNYQTLNKIKQKILNDHKDKIQWIEIETKGTKYIVKVEERKQITKKTSNTPRNIVAKKNAIIKKITASQGVIIKEKDEYVKKGDIIINGDIILEEKKTMGQVKAEGKVYGEVWYIIKTTYPFIYQEKKQTGKTKNTYTIKILNKDIELSLKKYKNKQIKEKTILAHPLLPIKLVYQNQKEIKNISQVLTFDEALIKAQKLSIKKIKNNLKKNEYIIRNKYLKSSVNNSTITVEMFFATYEDITDYANIDSKEE